jgi:polyribonucleotide nucleotidyltransferase
MIIEKTGAKIDIEDDGLVYIATPDGEAMERAKKLIIALTKDIEVGEVYEGIVEKIVTD